jgi:hypothetical protein
LVVLVYYVIAGNGDSVCEKEQHRGQLTIRCSGQPLRICKRTLLAWVHEESGEGKLNRLKLI